VTLKKTNLLLGQHNGLLSRVLFEAQQPVVARLDVVAKPDAPDTSRADVDVVQAKLVRHTLRPMGRELQGVIQNPLLDVGRDAVGMRDCADRASATPPPWKARFTS
jgi:hypothetical protein